MGSRTAGGTSGSGTNTESTVGGLYCISGEVGWLDGVGGGVAGERMDKAGVGVMEVGGVA